MCYNGDREAASGAAFPLFCAGMRLGPKKAPAGVDGKGASAVSRAQSGARTAPARNARPRARAPAQDTRELGFHRSGKPGGGADGTEWNETG